MPPENKLQEVTVEQIEKMRSGLKQLRDDLSQFLQLAGYSPAAKSQAANELASCPKPEFVHTVQCQGAFQIEIAADHLTAFLKTITNPVETIAPWACARSLLETSALASWMLDPAIDMRERVARGFAHRYEGLEQQVKFSASAGRDSKSNRQRIDKVEADATALGYDRVLDRRGKRIGIARQLPSTTELIQEVHRKADIYRLLSAFTHGHHWAIQQMSFKVIPDKKIEPAGDGIKLSIITKAVSLNGTAYLVLLAAEVFTLPFWRQCNYYGWDKAALEDILERNFDQIGASKKIRHWRTAARDA